MAEAAAHLSGRPQLVLATRAVGASNAAIGIHTARQDSVPLVALIGQVKRALRGREAFQETDLATSIGALALWAAEARDPADAVRLVAEGLRRQTHGRPGPILLSLPEDILDELVEGHAETAMPQPAVSADRSAVRQVLQWLAASERGVILAGGGVLRARASKRLTALSEAMAVPVIAAWRRPDVFPNDHPNYLGMTGYWAAPTVRRAPPGRRRDPGPGLPPERGRQFRVSVPAPGARWAHVDLEPRVAGHGLRAASLALAADAARFLDAAWSDLRGAALDAEMRGRRERGMAADREAYLAASRVDEVPWDGPGRTPRPRDRHAPARPAVQFAHRHRCRELRRLGGAWLPLRAPRHLRGSHLGGHGIRAPGRDRRLPAASRSARRRAVRRRRVRDDHERAGDGGPRAHPADRHRLRQSPVRHDPHAPGARRLHGGRHGPGRHRLRGRGARLRRRMGTRSNRTPTSSPRSRPRWPPAHRR